jgi:hypothetical protein
MVDDIPEDKEASPDLGRAKRAPPTIELKATGVSSETQHAAAAADTPAEPSPEETSQGSSQESSNESARSESAQESSKASSKTAVSSAIISAVCGAGAAALVIGGVWFSGWPATAPATPAVSAAAIDDLTARVASIESEIGESKAAKPAAAAAPDPAASARIDALEKSLASLRGEVAAAHTQSEKLTAAVSDIKAAPGDTTASPDLSAISERLTQIENATRAQSAEIAQDSAKLSDAKLADAKPADDVPLRRLVAASLLDVLVRTGDPYAAALSAAKSLADNADALKPLDGFAASGVPSAAVLCRELLTLVPKLSPPAQDTSAAGGGIVERLQAGAAKLVRIERTDVVGNDRGAIVARVTAAALRNDYTEARRELNTLSPADRAAAQPWIDKADARDAALATSRQFANAAMAALAKPAP